MSGPGGGSAAYTVTAPDNYLARLLTPILPALELTCCGLLASLLLWKGILPGWRILHTDFPNYYLVARLLREGYTLDRIYDWVWLQRIKDHWGIDQPIVGFAGLTPFSALPVVPFSFFSALLAKRLWIIFNLLCLATSIELFRRITTLGRRRLWLLSLLAVFPLRTSFLLGQMHLVVLLLVAVAYYYHRRSRPIASAVCLSLAGFLKIYPLCFGFYFLWKRQWRSAAAMLGSSLLLLAASYLLFGREAMNVYLIQVLPRSLQGEVLNPYSAQAASMAALFHQVFIAEPSLNPSPLWRAPGLYALLYPLWQLLILMPLFLLLPEKINHAETEPLEWAAFALALLVLSPVPASYHFVVLIFPMVLLVEHLLWKQRYGILSLAIALYCAISVIEWVPVTHQISSTSLIAFGRLWIELGLLAVFLVCLWRAQALRQTLPVNRNRVASLSGVAVVLWVAGSLGYYHHFKHLEEDLAARLRSASDAYLSTGLRYKPSGYLFVAMTADRYRVLAQNGLPVWNNPSGREQADQLSAAVAQSAGGVVIELADRTGSQVFALPSGPELTVPSTMAPLITNAESPALSANGMAVAFIREVKGRGTLWLARLQQPLGRLRSEPTPLTSGTYDVRDVTFTTSGRLLFTARADSHTSIYSLNPGSQPRILLSEREDVDAPAISPDEQRIAFRKLIGGRWQLGYLDAASGHEWILTTGDCNVYSPAWVAPAVIAYGSDCGRGLGLSALASIDVGPRFTPGAVSIARFLVSRMVNPDFSPQP